jgi:hypothetical protein
MSFDGRSRSGTRNPRIPKEIRIPPIISMVLYAVSEI